MPDPLTSPKLLRCRLWPGHFPGCLQRSGYCSQAELRFTESLRSLLKPIAVPMAVPMAVPCARPACGAFLGSSPTSCDQKRSEILAHFADLQKKSILFFNIYYIV